MELKGRRELFAREYLKDLNGTQAALRAGYSPNSARTEASQLLAIDEVQARIAELANARNEKFEVDAVEVLRELHRMLTADVAQAFNDDGSLKPIHEIPIDLRRTIAGFDCEEIYEWVGERRDREKVESGRLKKVKFWSKEKAAELLGKHLALFVERLKVEGLDELANKLAAARERQPLV